MRLTILFRRFHLHNKLETLANINYLWSWNSEWLLPKLRNPDFDRYFPQFFQDTFWCLFCSKIFCLVSSNVSFLYVSIAFSIFDFYLSGRQDYCWSHRLWHLIRKIRHLHVCKSGYFHPKFLHWNQTDWKYFKNASYHLQPKNSWKFVYFLAKVYRNQNSLQFDEFSYLMTKQPHWGVRQTNGTIWCPPSWRLIKYLKQL